MSSETAIRTQGLGKVYRLYNHPQDRLKEALFRRTGLGHDFWALRDLDLEVKRGETVGIIGRNGSGKSTLLQLVCGTVQPSSGELEVNGRVAAMLELGAGFNPEFTGRENVELSCSVLGLSEKQIEERFGAIEAFAEIGDFIDQPVRQYSSGMYARLAFSVCAHVDADILVVDEILAVGDAGFQQRCMRYLHSFRERGTLLFVSHDEGAVTSLCDRAVWLDRGVTQAIGESKDVCARYRTYVSRTMADARVFQSGGMPRAVTAAAAPSIVPGKLKAFDFDLDATWARKGEPMIERAMMLHPDGHVANVVDGGAEVVLRVEVNPARELDEPVVAFLVRNRFGQVVFRDDTATMTSQVTPAKIAKGRRFAASFRFRVPHLPTGDYAIEPWLFERQSAGPIDRQVDTLFIRVSSAPHLGGVANASIEEIRVVIGTGPATRKIVWHQPVIGPATEDPRWRGKNPIDIVPFNVDAPWYGHGGGRVENMDFVFLDGSVATQLEGGNMVEMRIHARFERRVSAPALGFMMRNSLGQNIFGDNTVVATRDADRYVDEGETMVASFCFRIPYLPTGDYTLAPSIIDGTQSDHIHVHWMEEAVVLRVSESPVSRSVVGVPMQEVRLDMVEMAADRSAA
jgi:lipopolysaccharide transport system ATP-binding protein